MDSRTSRRRSALAEASAALAESRRAVERLAFEREQLAARVGQLEEDRDARERQRQALHATLGAWRARATEVESTRALRLRRRLIQLRSRVERRTQTGTADPCVIGATGGSGTRIFARLAAQGGLDVGGDRNEFEDALPIERFLDRWLVAFWQGGGAEPPHPAPPGMDDDFRTALVALAGGAAAPPRPRGWKSPRSLFVLPFLAQRFPDLRFLHVVRDGRDMALSANQLQLGRYGAMMLTADERAWSEPERSIALWSRVNLWAASLGERLGAAYLGVRMEDLCARPVAVTRRLFRFFELPGDARRAARSVEPPATLGRWRDADPALVARLEAIAGPQVRVACPAAGTAGRKQAARTTHDHEKRTSDRCCIWSLTF